MLLQALEKSENGVEKDTRINTYRRIKDNRLIHNVLTCEKRSPTLSRLEVGLQSDAVWTGVGCKK